MIAKISHYLSMQIVFGIGDLKQSLIVMNKQKTSSISKKNFATVSVVVPVYSGQAYLEDLLVELQQTASMWLDAAVPAELAEVILIDDAAIDDSPKLMDQLAKTYPWVVSLHLSQNFGQHAATVAGILNSSGDWIVTMDEDLQHPPSRILDLVNATVQQGADIAYAQPVGDVHGKGFRDSSSKTFKRIMSWITGNPNLPFFNSFRLIRGSVARAAASVCGNDTYFDVNLSWFSARVVTVPMELHDMRYQNARSSGYKLASLISHGLRMIFSSHIRILRGGAILGLTILLLSIVSTIWVIGQKIFVPESINLAGWPSLILAISFFGGLSVFLLGIALQYLSILVLRAHGKPSFFVIDRSKDRVLSAYFSDD
jgi:glycosyltransferase involved in cell wall biosynthesis